MILPDAGLRLVPALERLAAVLDDGGLRLPVDGAAASHRERRQAVRTLREQLVPRLTDEHAPLVAAFFGPTGSGKSLLVNALAGRHITPSGSLRPTTTVPVLWAHRRHAGRYWHDLLARIRTRSGPEVETVVSEDELTRDLTIMDTPPFDGGEAADLLVVADLCVFVTSAERYADAATWRFLDGVRDRAIPTVFVLNRCPVRAEERRAVAADFAARLAAAGLLLEPDPAAVFAVVERDRVADGPALADAVAPLRAELERLNDPIVAGSLVAQTLSASLRHVVEVADRLFAMLVREQETRVRLVDAVEQAYRSSGDRLAATFPAGRWSGLGPAGAAAAADALAGAVSRHAGTAAQVAAAAWRQDAAGSALLETDLASLWRHGPTAGPHAAAVVSSWWSSLPGRVDAHGRRRRHRRRPLVRALAGDVFTGAGPSDALVRRLGSEQAGHLVAAATHDLVGGLQRALAVDAARFVDAVGDPRGFATAADRLAAAVDEIRPDTRVVAR